MSPPRIRARRPRATAPSLVAFAPDATAAAITAFLDANHAVIVDGPHAGGTFRVPLASSRLPSADLDRLVAHLRQDTKIVRLIIPAP